ncbi:MAG: hypothetical protein IPN34_12195 [Planctomycetes bacterium]|nr:hypothetical protein [Planctomycetota bacterium]
MRTHHLPLALHRIAFVLGLALLSPGQGYSQSDECAGAGWLSEGVNGPFSNASATNNPTDPLFACGGNPTLAKDVWFRYRPAVSGTVTFELCAPLASFDTRLEFYDGSCGGLTLVQCNDDACGLQSRLSIYAYEFTTYVVRIAGYEGASGSFSLRVISADSCEGAVDIADGLNGPYQNFDASSSAPPWTCGVGGRDLWFRYVATCTGMATADLCNSELDTIVEAYSGSCGTLVSLGCNDDEPGCVDRSKLSFPVIRGSSYLLRVGGAIGAMGTFRIQMGCGYAPTNDTCSAPIPLALGSHGPFSNLWATTSSPGACSLSTFDLWYGFTAPCDASFTFDTCGSSLDTVLNVFSGSCSNLSSLGCNDDACGNQSRVSVNLLRGQQVLVMVGSYAGHQGSFLLNISGGGTLPNDECIGATPLSVGDNGPFTTVGATTSSPSMGCSSASCDVWHSFTAPCSGDWIFDTCGAAFDTVLQVYSGSCASPTSLGCNDDACGLQSRVTATGLLAGQTVLVRVGGFAGLQGTYGLRASLTGEVGSISNVATRCGGLRLSATGAPTLASSLTFTLGGGSGATTLWFGAAIGPIQICSPEPCALGANLDVILGSVTSVRIPVPCDGSLIGGSVACQGVDLILAPGTCPPGQGFHLDFSNTLIVTLN